MYRVLIAIVDAAVARLFSFERTSDGEGLHDQLTELGDLVNPARRLRPSELFSDSGRGASHTGEHGYTLDDRREDHMARLDGDFAQSVATELARLATDVDRLVLCASPHMLGHLRDVTVELHRPGLIIDELPRDLVKLTPPQLRDQLASYGFLPPPLPRPTLDERRP